MKARGNSFAVWVTSAVVLVVLAVGGIVAMMNNQATGAGVAPQGNIIDSDTGAIAFGSGGDVVDTFVDFMCPVCTSFESQYGEELQSAAAADKITLNIHPVAILNRLSQGTEYSTRSASAMYCVAAADPANALTFFNLLYANQPEEGSAGLTDEQLVMLAQQSGVDSAADCITDGTYMKFVDARTKEIPAGSSGSVGTPTVLLKGEYVENPLANTSFSSFVEGLAG